VLLFSISFAVAPLLLTTVLVLAGVAALFYWFFLYLRVQTVATMRPINTIMPTTIRMIVIIPRPSSFSTLTSSRLVGSSSGTTIVVSVSVESVVSSAFSSVVSSFGSSDVSSVTFSVVSSVVSPVCSSGSVGLTGSLTSSLAAWQTVSRVIKPS